MISQVLCIVCTVMLRDSMRPSGALATVLLLVLTQLLCFKPVHAEESGTVIPAESKTLLAFIDVCSTRMYHCICHYNM